MVQPMVKGRGMARNPVQFPQKGIRLAAFQSCYGTEEQCRTALIGLRWSEQGLSVTCAAAARTASMQPVNFFSVRSAAGRLRSEAGTIFRKMAGELPDQVVSRHLPCDAKQEQEMSARWKIVASAGSIASSAKHMTSFVGERPRTALQLDESFATVMGFDGGEKRHLPRRAPSGRPPSFPAKIGVVDLHRAFELVGLVAFRHDSHKLVLHPPSRVVFHAQKCKTRPRVNGEPVAAPRFNGSADTGMFGSNATTVISVAPAEQPMPSALPWSALISVRPPERKLKLLPTRSLQVTVTHDRCIDNGNCADDLAPQQNIQRNAFRRLDYPAVSAGLQL